MIAETMILSGALIFSAKLIACGLVALANSIDGDG